MQLVPVIDLLRGQVVRGIQGRRESYRPIVSALCGTAEPLAVARVLCEHCASDTLYVADLDSLQGAPAQTVLLGRLLKAMPRLTLWLDAGFADAEAAARLLAALDPAAAVRVLPVFASESLRSPAALATCFNDPALLSLDRRDGQRLDPAGCWERLTLWPERVIVMTLERVGADSGPDLDTLRAVAASARPCTRLIGAGGIRSEADLSEAEAAGADAWLVASALHDLRLSPRRGG
ncbi:HisA/HisF-related TIM barrel protein [Paucibacter sp. R3-3]|uniref:HisA/HisF-related TIM barrel protein n=1 Tax=Roseateles agri TaxID=3098619 RepID=A0ABU5DR69_9BURK|nr:HisA/HisF-related TIM barrel protein [Paucibacter sp. R3-3]MDY0748821.1 HisA/HisF-related TIM barrel protein [Paucibacter sp. R3-3]